ncbi:MAG TPA: potassium transporter TrkG [Sedimentisphaerales bacterium]|nr:potassium transporter TrkG [Sedimentisphaerales bacterium]
MWAWCALGASVRRLCVCSQRTVTFFQAGWLALKPAQMLACGFLSYALAGTALLSLPFARQTSVRLVDNVFNVVSAISTTGLATISVPDSYTFFGQFVLLALFQLGGIGYMTTTSFIILARGRPLSETRVGVFNAGFSLPQGFRVARFIRHIVIFSLVIETVGAALLYIEFRSYGVAQPLWSAVFHSVSAFATAGFSLNNNSLEDFRASGIVNVTIGALCYLGAIGFIVLQDAYLSSRSRRRRITFTSKVILAVTALVLAAEMPLFLACEPSLRSMPIHERIYAAFFQIMAASTTSGFNSIPIGQLSAASLTLIVVAMVIGASPSGTGGGIKTTSLSILLGIAGSTLRGRSTITFFRHQIPPHRVATAVASTTLYMGVLAGGVFLLSLTEKQDYLKLVFETASALGTVGLSMGITGELTDLGKWIVTAIMFIGRVGPLTLGFALMHSACEDTTHAQADLAT